MNNQLDPEIFTPEVTSFVKAQLAQGTSADGIRNMLVTQGGWTDSDVDLLLANLAGGNAPKTTIPETPTPAPQNESDEPASQPDTPQTIAADNSGSELSDKHSHAKVTMIIVIVFLLLGVVFAAAGYSYVKKIGPFSSGVPYSEGGV